MTWKPCYGLSVENLKVNRSEADILFELLLKVGLDLCTPIEVRAIIGKQVHSIWRRCAYRLSR